MWKKGRELAESFKRELTVYRRVLADPRTPVSAKVFLGLAIGYLCMPFDLIPDFIPVLGYVDDAVIVPALVYLALRLIPPELVAEHRAQAISENMQPYCANGRSDILTSDNSTEPALDDLRAGRRLEYFTLGWNLTEAAVAVGAGVFAGSIALIGFGIDSLIESLSGGILLWRLHATDTTEKRERLARRLVSVSFFVLAFYVAFEAGKSLLRHEEPETSVVGIALSVVSLIVMPLLARAKRRVAAKLDSRALRAHSRQTDICAYLSAILLGGLLLNAFFGWWWADPIAAVCMLPLIFREGMEAVRDGPSCHHESFQLPK
jgi:uncharacterized membrane protein YkvA (DUF1232 family)/Co/Zn/Cd efflux system component